MSRELDERVARAMGWHWDDDWGCLIPPEQTGKPEEMWTDWIDNGYGEEHRAPIKANIVSGTVYNGNFTKIILPEFSSDIAATWQVVEWMITGKIWECYIEHQTDGWECSFCEPANKGGYGKAPTAPEAICLSFLAAVEEQCMPS